MALLRFGSCYFVLGPQLVVTTGLGHRGILSGRLLKQVRWIIPLTVTTARSGAVLLQAANA